MMDEEDEDFEETLSMTLDPSKNIIPAVEKVMFQIPALSVVLTSF